MQNLPGWYSWNLRGGAGVEKEASHRCSSGSLYIFINIVRFFEIINIFFREYHRPMWSLINNSVKYTLIISLNIEDLVLILIGLAESGVDAAHMKQDWEAGNLFPVLDSYCAFPYTCRNTLKSPISSPVVITGGNRCDEISIVFIFPHCFGGLNSLSRLRWVCLPIVSVPTTAVAIDVTFVGCLAIRPILVNGISQELLAVWTQEGTD